MTSTAGPHSSPDLLRGAAHLLRSPLGVVLGLSATLRDYDHRFTADQRTMYLGEILQAAEEMSIVLDGLSLLARVAAGALAFAPTAIALEDLTESGGGVLAGVWGADAVESRVLAGSTVRVDRQRIHQALDALARMFSPAPGAALNAIAGPGLQLGPVVLQAPGDDMIGLIGQPLTHLDMAALVARPGGWALLLARHLLEMQGASLNAGRHGDDGAMSLVISLPAAAS